MSNIDHFISIHILYRKNWQISSPRRWQKQVCMESSLYVYKIMLAWKFAVITHQSLARFFTKLSYFYLCFFCSLSLCKGNVGGKRLCCGRWHCVIMPMYSTHLFPFLLPSPPLFIGQWHWVGGRKYQIQRNYVQFFQAILLDHFVFQPFTSYANSRLSRFSSK